MTDHYADDPTWEEVGSIVRGHGRSWLVHVRDGGYEAFGSLPDAKRFMTELWERRLRYASMNGDGHSMFCYIRTDY